MFPRGPPKVCFRLKEGLSSERVFGEVEAADFREEGRLSVAVLTGSITRDSKAYAALIGLLKAHRSGSVVRITVATAEAIAAGDFGEFVKLKSIARGTRFTVWIKAKERAGIYLIGRSGKIMSKVVSASAALDSYT
jgi:hypothetical protein